MKAFTASLCTTFVVLGSFFLVLILNGLADPGIANTSAILIAGGLIGLAITVKNPQ